MVGAHPHHQQQVLEEAGVCHLPQVHQAPSAESPLNLQQPDSNTSLKATGDLLEQAMAQLNSEGDQAHTVVRTLA